MIVGKEEGKKKRESDDRLKKNEEKSEGRSKLKES